MEFLCGGYHNRVRVIKLHPQATPETNNSHFTIETVSDAGPSPSYFVISSDGKVAYSVNEVDPEGFVTAFTIGGDGKLTKMNSALSKGGWPCHVTLSPNEKWLFCSNYKTSSVAVHPVNPDRTVGDLVELLSPGGPEGNTHQVTFNKAGTHFYVPCKGADFVALYLFDQSSGKVTPHPENAFVSLQKGAGPRHIKLSSNEKKAYLINELDYTVTAFDVTSSFNLINPFTVSTLPLGTPGHPDYSTACIVVTKDGRFVYGSNRGHNTLVAYKVGQDANEAILTPIGWENGDCSVSKPRDFSLSPDESFLVCANQAGDSLTLFSRDAETGLLTFLERFPLDAESQPCFIGFYHQ